jgi:hypothetical protein
MHFMCNRICGHAARVLVEFQPDEFSAFVELKRIFASVAYSNAGFLRVPAFDSPTHLAKPRKFSASSELASPDSEELRLIQAELHRAVRSSTHASPVRTVRSSSAADLCFVCAMSEASGFWIPCGHASLRCRSCSVVASGQGVRCELCGLHAESAGGW